MEPICIVSRRLPLSILVLLTALASAVPAAARSTAAPATGDPTAAAPEPKVAGAQPAAYASDRVIVRWKDAGKAAASERARGLARVQGLQAPGAASVLQTGGRHVDQVLAELRADANVAWAEPDYRVTLAGEVTAVLVNDRWTGSQYTLDRMRVRDAWSVETGGSNVIAVLDTGVQANHPDLLGRVVAGW
ncbi:MAG TPA: hypothetical protein VHK06_05930, partial [Candidatus Limnocylindria bacterium]|nr:hypothetical protein [Candidatus Limnocylindria bacterium]